ncbi:MAG: adenine deaminase [Rhodobacteraceae bacterium]|nr:adenine deaminase [Paracoccaceae bacterium]
MSANTSIPSWQNSAASLVAVAAGREPADLVVRNCRWVNVHSREILEDHDIAVVQGRFAYCGPDASHCVGDGTEILDAEGQYAVPGLCDGHMHIESGLLTPARFAEAVIPHGTTTMFADPHEIANVLGIDGVRLMHDEAMLQPVNMLLQMPSCAPSAPGLETPGAEISPADVREAMGWPGIAGLGEMMNFPGVIGGDPKMLAEIAATMESGKVVGGHYASPDLGPAFHAYAAGGPADDHEGTREIDAISRARQGMKAMLRLGSAWYDVEKQITAITEKGLDSRNFILCTDDCHPGTLVHEGHMNRVVRHAVDCGCDPVIALQMASLNTATHFGLEREIGSIAPGRSADMLLTSCLKSLPVHRVVARGRTLAVNGELTMEMPKLTWPGRALDTVRLGRKLEAEDFLIPAPEGASRVRAKVIGVIENQAPTRALVMDVAVADGVLSPDESRDICQLALVERHRATGGVVNALVSGFRYRGRMAVASTIAHDSHHMIVVGTGRREMALAANRLAEVSGGITVWLDGREIALVQLPVAGLMSEDPASAVAAAANGVSEAMRKCGCPLNNALMQHTLLALPVIPELRISDLGLVDATRFKLTDLLERG